MTARTRTIVNAAFIAANGIAVLLVGAEVIPASPMSAKLTALGLAVLSVIGRTVIPAIVDVGKVVVVALLLVAGPVRADPAPDGGQFTTTTTPALAAEIAPKPATQTAGSPPGPCALDPKQCPPSPPDPVARWSALIGTIGSTILAPLLSLLLVKVAQ